jgi:hypothetical protein
MQLAVLDRVLKAWRGEAVQKQIDPGLLRAGVAGDLGESG